MNEISFTSRIVPLKFSDFNKITSGFSRNNLVDYPWTIDTGKVAKDVFTFNICDCTVCLIKSRERALLLHLTPSNKNNHFFNNVLLFLRNNIDLKDKNLQAVLLGSKDTKISQNIWNKFVNLLDHLRIPTTVLKNAKSPTNLAYKTCTDEVLISNEHIDKSIKKGINIKDTILNSFSNVKIASCDEI